MVQEGKDVETSERLTRVEVQLENITKAVTSMNDKLDVWNQSYVPRSELDLKFEAITKEQAATDKKFVTMENNKWSIRNAWPAWLGVAIATISLLERFM